MHVRTFFGSRSRSYPATRARPLSGGSSVARMRSIVVFPAPLGPRKPKISPFWTCKSTPLRASTWTLLRSLMVLKLFHRASTSMIGIISVLSDHRLLVNIHAVCMYIGEKKEALCLGNASDKDIDGLFRVCFEREGALIQQPCTCDSIDQADRCRRHYLRARAYPDLPCIDASLDQCGNMFNELSCPLDLLLYALGQFWEGFGFPRNKLQHRSVVAIFFWIADHLDQECAQLFHRRAVHLEDGNKIGDRSVILLTYHRIKQFRFAAKVPVYGAACRACLARDIVQCGRAIAFFTEDR